MRKVATGATVGGSLGGAIGENFLLRPPQVFNETLRIAALPRGVRILQVPFLTPSFPLCFFLPPSIVLRLNSTTTTTTLGFCFFWGFIGDTAGAMYGTYEAFRYQVSILAFPPRRTRGGRED